MRVLTTWLRWGVLYRFPMGINSFHLPPFCGRFFKYFLVGFSSGTSRIAGFGEGTPQQDLPKGQNRRIADFGTVVETCSVTAADCPCRFFPYIERTGQGFRLAMGGLFSFPLKIHFKGRQLPAGRGFFKISFASVIRVAGFWQPAGQRIFPFTPYTTAL